MTPLPDRCARTGLAALALSACLALSAPAHAAMADDPLEGLEPIDRAELAESRGGIMVNGIPINFAVVMRTTIQDATVHGLETVFTMMDNGHFAAPVSTTIGGADGVGLARDGNSVRLTLPSGFSVLHQQMAGQVFSQLSNVSNNVTLSQTTDLNIELPGMKAASQTWSSAARASRAGIDAALSGIRSR